MLGRTAGAVTAIVLTLGAFAFPRQHMEKWVVRGEAIVACPCKVPCPCRSNARPSQPHCENLSYVRVVEGHHGTTKLDGLEYVWAADECGSSKHPEHPTQLYFRRSVTAAQIAAIEHIMEGNACSPGDGAAIRVKRAALTTSVNGSVYSVSAPKLFQLDVELAPGPMPMEPLPALDSWSNTVTYARNVITRMHDSEAQLHWDYSGLQANYRSFEVTSDLFNQGLMLALFRDDAGKFNEMHRSLIHDLHLEVPLTRDEFQKMLAQTQAAETISRSPKITPAVPAGSIGGIVFAVDGKPRSGARIQVAASEQSRVPIVVSNPLGRYFIARLPAGSYEVCATSWDGKTAEKACVPAVVKSGSVSAKDLKLSTVRGV